MSQFILFFFKSKRHQAIAPILLQTFGNATEGEQVVTVKDFKGPAPDLSNISALPSDANFSVFNKTHREYANELIGIFMGKSNSEIFFVRVQIQVH